MKDMSIQVIVTGTRRGYYSKFKTLQRPFDSQVQNTRDKFLKFLDRQITLC